MYKYLCKKYCGQKIMEWLDGLCGDLFLRHTLPFFSISISSQYAFLCNYTANCDTILSYIFVFVTLALYGSLLLLRFYLISSSHIIIFIVKHTYLYLTLCGTHLFDFALWACKFLPLNLFLKNNDHHKTKTHQLHLIIANHHHHRLTFITYLSIHPL